MREESESARGPEAQAPAVEGERGGETAGLPPSKPKPVPRWVRAAPFFLSAFLFLSGLFAVLSPLPLLMLGFRGGRRWSWLAALTNALIVGIAGGTASLGFYVVFVLALSLSLPEFLATTRKVEAAAGYTLLTMLAAGGLVVGGVAHSHHVNPVAEARNEISSVVDFAVGSLSSDNAGEEGKSLLGDVDPVEWKHDLMVELPSAISIFALVLVWANLVAVLRLNPGRVRERYGLAPGTLGKWKAPDALVWPTIASGALLLWDTGWPSDVALNLFRFLMAVYAIQGLSILAHIFDVWNVRGLVRSLAYLAALFLMMPLVLSLGFFDLWFDFRAKFRQSS